MPVKYEGPTTEMEKAETSVFGIPVSRQDKLEDERIRREVQQKRLERTQRRQRRNRRRLLAAAWAAAAVALMVSYHFGLRALWYAAPKGDISNGGVDISQIRYPDWIDQAFIENPVARTGTPLTEVKDLAIHYVGNPGSSAMGNRNYFNSEGVEVCSHFVVGLEGEVIQCLPLNEQSVATNQRNKDTISIEVCHPDETGKYSEVTYNALIRLVTWLCRQFHLTQENLIRHYDVSGKLCPLYYVQHEDAWLQLKEDVGEELNAYR